LNGLSCLQSKEVGEMAEAKKTLLVPQCVLTRGLDRNKTGSYSELEEMLKVIKDSNAGIVQLPCPHLISIMKQEVETHNQAINKNIFIKNNLTSTYTRLYHEMLIPVFQEIENCRKHGIQIAGLIGVKGSPCCSARNSKDGSVGEFMKVLVKELENRSINIEVVNI
jgi:predicted secreted protein